MVNLHSPVLSAKDSCAYGFVTLPVPGTLNNPVLLTATLVSLWNVMSGIYLYVFTLVSFRFPDLQLSVQLGVRYYA